MVIFFADPPMPADRTMAPARHLSVSAVQEVMNGMKNSNRCKQDQHCYPDDDTDLHGTHLSVNVYVTPWKTIYLQRTSVFQIIRISPLCSFSTASEYTEYPIPCKGSRTAGHRY
jgi:hypothetical protein